MEPAVHYQKVIDSLPSLADGEDVLQFLMAHDITGSYFHVMKEITQLNDEYIASLLSMDVKTFRKYKAANSSLNAITGEYTVLLLSLYKHGQSAFGSFEAFGKWLEEPNFFFDGKMPIEFFTTTSGIRHLDDRLTAMEYGDNA